MNERRRTLLFSKSNIPTENGVYIESVDHEFYLTDNWDSANTANSIAVVADEHKFRIALTQRASTMTMNPNAIDPWETYLSGTTNSGTADSTVAKKDYNGATNTHLIVTKCQSSTGYAAGWCDAYTFPDGSKGYLPAVGELYLASQNMEAINAALTKCGGTAFGGNYYWSSTFYGMYGFGRYCWNLHRSGDGVDYDSLVGRCYVRAFSALEDSN